MKSGAISGSVRVHNRFMYRYDQYWFLDRYGFIIGSWTSMGLASVPGYLWVYFQSQGRYGFLSGSRTGMNSVFVPGPVWIYDRIHDRYGIMIGSRADMGSRSVAGPG